MYNEDEIKAMYTPTSEEFEQMYKNIKKLTLTNVKKTNGRPVAIFTGGQPAAGKTGLILKSNREYKDLVLLDLDNYRGFYKKTAELANKYPELYQEITNKYSSEILERLSNDVIDSGYNFILEGTMGKSVYTLDVLQKKQADYDIIARVLAVSKEESLYSAFERYLEMKKSIGIGRWTTIQSHNERYDNLINVVSLLEGRGVQVEVYERSDEIENPALLYMTNNKFSKCCSVIDAILTGRKRSYEKWKKTAKQRIESINDEMECIEENEKILNEVKLLKKITMNELSKGEDERTR